MVIQPILKHCLISSVAHPKELSLKFKGKRPDTLYQDINADMKFNTSFISKAGKKIESEDCNLEKDVFVAFNLTLKKDGSFGGTKLWDGKYNITSYALASHVIELFYLERESVTNT